MKKFYLFGLTMLSLGLATSLNAETLSEMEQRIGQMGVVELQDRKAFLLQEQEGTQNPSRLKEIAAELSAIRPPEPYKGKGVRYKGEQITLKETKKAV